MNRKSQEADVPTTSNMPDKSSEQDGKTFMLLGGPNVGKSVLFRLLSGKYAMVSKDSRGNAKGKTISR